MTVAVQISCGVGDRVSTRGKRRTGGVAKHRGFFPSESAPVRRSLPPPSVDYANCRDISNSNSNPHQLYREIMEFRVSLDSEVFAYELREVWRTWNRDTRGASDSRARRHRVKALPLGPSLRSHDPLKSCTETPMWIPAHLRAVLQTAAGRRRPWRRRSAGVGHVCPTVISRWISSDLNPIASAERTRGNIATS